MRLRRLPCSIKYPERTDFLNRETTPVSPSVFALQATATLAAVLINEQTPVPFFVPSQHVRTEQPYPPIVNRRHRTPAGYRCLDQRISLTQRVNRDCVRTPYSLSSHNLSLQSYP
jgi:hypothetical protein